MTYNVSSGTLNSSIPYHTMFVIRVIVLIRIPRLKFVGEMPTISRQQFQSELKTHLFKRAYIWLLPPRTIEEWTYLLPVPKIHVCWFSSGVKRPDQLSSLKRARDWRQKSQHLIDIQEKKLKTYSFSKHILTTFQLFSFLLCCILTPFYCAYLQHNCTQLVILYVSWLCTFS